MSKTITAQEIDEAVIQSLREFLVPLTPHTREVARKMTARLRHAGLLRAPVIVTPRPDIQYKP